MVVIKVEPKFNPKHCPIVTFQYQLEVFNPQPSHNILLSYANAILSGRTTYDMPKNR